MIFLEIEEDVEERILEIEKISSSKEGDFFLILLRDEYHECLLECKRISAFQEHIINIEEHSEKELNCFLEELQKISSDRDMFFTLNYDKTFKRKEIRTSSEIEFFEFLFQIEKERKCKK